MDHVRTKLSELLDWRGRDYTFYGIADGRGALLASGQAPAVGRVLILRSPRENSDGCCYRVADVREAFAYGYGFTADLQHVPGEQIDLT